MKKAMLSVEAAIDPSRSRRRKTWSYYFWVFCFNGAVLNFITWDIKYFCPKQLFQTIKLLIKRISWITITYFLKWVFNSTLCSFLRSTVSCGRQPGIWNSRMSWYPLLTSISVHCIKGNQLEFSCCIAMSVSCRECVHRNDATLSDFFWC